MTLLWWLMVKQPTLLHRPCRINVNHIINWLNKWRLKPNPIKSQLILFHHKISDTSPTITINNNIIKPSQTAKYLGIKLDGKLNFKIHTQEIKKNYY